MNMQEGYEVIDAFDVQDLSEVKQDSNLFPATKDLKVRIAKAQTQKNKDEDIYSLKLELRVVDGIPNNDGGTSRVNAVLFNSLMDLVYGANTEVKGRSENRWWKNKQHLVEFKNLMNALGISLSGIKINEEFLSSLVGQEVLVTVRHEAETIKNSDGTKTKTGSFQQKLGNWKKAL